MEMVTVTLNQCQMEYVFPDAQEKSLSLSHHAKKAIKSQTCLGRSLCVQLWVHKHKHLLSATSSVEAKVLKRSKDMGLL